MCSTPFAIATAAAPAALGAAADAAAACVLTMAETSQAISALSTIKFVFVLMSSQHDAAKQQPASWTGILSDCSALFPPPPSRQICLYFNDIRCESVFMLDRPAVCLDNVISAQRVTSLSPPPLSFSPTRFQSLTSRQ